MDLSLLRNLSANLIDLLYPPQCVWCSQPTASARRLCDACQALFYSNYYRCKKCANPLPSVLPNQDCIRCRHAKWQFSEVVTLAPYRGELRKAVILMKKPSCEVLRTAVGELLAQALLAEKIVARGNFKAASRSAEALDQPPLVIPVPNYWSHGFSAAADTAGSLAQAIARSLGTSVASGTIRRIRKTAKQGMLSWTERSQNVRGAFSVVSAKRLTGRHVLLVDDVLTSGATAAELSRLLRKAGAVRVSVVVAARGTGAREMSNPTAANAAH